VFAESTLRHGATLEPPHGGLPVFAEALQGLQPSAAVRLSRAGLDEHIRNQKSQRKSGTRFSRVWQAIDEWVTSNPYIAAFFVAAFKATLSDVFAQTLKREKIVWRRSAAFCLYGGIYQGCIQQLLYINCFNAMFGTGDDLRTVATKVLFDQFVHSPFLAIPLVYLFKAVMFNYSFREGLERYVHDAKRDLLITCWVFWIPAQCLTFSIVPQQWRISFVALVSFFWLCAVSIISGRADKPADSAADQIDDNTRPVPAPTGQAEPEEKAKSYERSRFFSDASTAVPGWRSRASTDVSLATSAPEAAQGG